MRQFSQNSFFKDNFEKKSNTQTYQNATKGLAACIR